MEVEKKETSFDFEDFKNQAISDLKAIAEIKMADLNANTIDQAVSMMMGTCVSMGIEVKGK